MGEHFLNEVIHNGMVLKFYIDVNECQDIENFVDNYIRVTISNTMECIGVLKKVSTWSKKEKGEVVGIYKEITLMIENIGCKEGVVRFPDRKDVFLEDFVVKFITE